MFDIDSNISIILFLINKSQLNFQQNLLKSPNLINHPRQRILIIMFQFTWSNKSGLFLKDAFSQNLSLIYTTVR